MLGKVLVVLMAVALSYGLTAFAGYILIRFIASPTIAILIGILVDFPDQGSPYSHANNRPCAMDDHAPE
jgi:hypothetical protein